jgi:hypothetical protein
MLAALQLVRDVERLQAEPSVPAAGAPLQPASDENVTALVTARAGKKD